MKNIKKEIVFYSNKLIELGLNIGSEGNISYRDEETVFITPSGIDCVRLKEDKIAEVDFNGKSKNKIKASSELFMHLFIYKERPEVKAIIHCHSEWASIVSCQRLKIPAFHYMVAEFGGIDIKCAKYSTFGTKSLAKNVLEAIKLRNGCLISNHGQLTLGNSIENALHLAISLEKLSKQFFFCNLSNKLKVLKKTEMSKVLRLFKSYKSTH
tara:strand:- start:859 stop:1491 length:633 start_codon:yes stop_codon:yes gene_type:complete